jgi:hypothetical protein
VPEFEAKRYEGKLREGNILISVHTENGEERRRAKDILEQHGADDVSGAGEEGVDDDDERRERDREHGLR